MGGDRNVSSSAQQAGVSMDAIPHFPNHLLAALPATDFKLLRPYLHTIELVQEVVLVAAGDALTHFFFPHSGVISLVVSLAAGEKVEVAMIGKDSVFGGSAAPGRQYLANRRYRSASGHRHNP
jgi:CRP-like cAMP-binding protein